MTHPGPSEVYHAGSASFRKLNPHLVAGQVLADPYQVKGEPYETPQIKQEGAKRRLRQKSGGGMNPWEREFFEHLRQTMPNHTHYAQQFTLKLGNGCRYTPDFVSVFPNNMWRMVVHEVKGFMRDDAAVKIKWAAKEFKDCMVFRLVTKKKGGAGWDIEEVLK